MNQATRFDPRFYYFRLVCGAIMISFSGVWVKVSNITPTATAFYRVFFGGLILLVISLWRAEIKRPSGPQSGLLVVCGLFFAVDLILFHLSIILVGPGLGTILPNFQVFILGLVGVVYFKETLTKISVAAMPMAILGLALIVGFQWKGLSPQYKTGIFCGLGTALCYSGYLLSLRKLQANEPEGSVVFIVMAVSMITAVFIAAEMWRRGEGFGIPDTRTLLALIALGFLSQSVGWILITNALPHIRTSLSGLILLIQPALAFVWDVLFFQRPTSVINWAGLVITLTAIYMGAAKARQAKPSGPART